MKSKKVKSLAQKAEENEMNGLSNRDDVVQWWHRSIAYGSHTRDVEPLGFILPMYSSGMFLKEDGRPVMDIRFFTSISERGEWRQNTRRISNAGNTEYE